MAVRQKNNKKLQKNKNPQKTKKTEFFESKNPKKQQKTTKNQGCFFLTVQPCASPIFEETFKQKYCCTRQI